MKSKIKRVQSVRLLNSEYSIFVSQLVAIFQQYDLDLLHLKKAFEKLFALLPMVVKIQVQEFSSPLSISLRELDRERDALINLIINYVKAVGKLRLASIIPHVLVMKRFVKIHVRDIAKANYNGATKLTKDMLDNYEVSEDVKAAVEALSLKLFFDYLRTVNQQFADMYLQRIDEVTEVEIVDARSIRIETDKVLKDLLDAFEFCSGEYEELDYETPAKKLNELTTSYILELKGRATRGKEDADVSKMEPIAGAAI